MKPTKPYKSFPLTPHPTGWVKKIRGKVMWIAGLIPPDEALAIWHEKAPALLAGTPPVKNKSSRISLEWVAEKFLGERLADLEAGKIKNGYYIQCRRAVRRMLRSIGGKTRIADLTPDDFMKLGRSVERRGRRTAQLTATIICSLFAEADEQDWIDAPVKIGKFRKLRKTPKGSRHKEDVDIFTAEECRIILAGIDRYIAKLKAGMERDTKPARQLKAMILLGLNGGYGATDLAELPRVLPDLDGPHPQIDYRRGKTGVRRLVPLWPETVAALRDVLAMRPDDDLVFRTRHGQPWARALSRTDAAGVIVKITTIDSVSHSFVKLLRWIERTDKVELKRSGHGFYLLKHTHRTASGGAGDESAADVIVGHALPGMREVYQQVRKQPERLRRVVEYVRHWLWPQS